MGDSDNEPNSRLEVLEAKNHELEDQVSALLTLYNQSDSSYWALHQKQHELIKEFVLYKTESKAKISQAEENLRRRDETVKRLKIENQRLKQQQRIKSVLRSRHCCSKNAGSVKWALYATKTNKESRAIASGKKKGRESKAGNDELKLYQAAAVKPSSSGVGKGETKQGSHYAAGAYDDDNQKPEHYNSP